MTYRYIHLLMRQIEDIYLARKSRIIGREKRGSERRWVSSQIKFVLKSSLNMGEHVYSAMVSRGFTHELRIIENFNLRRIDYIWLIFSIFIIGITLGLNWL
jgi:cobalt/nickel transport system permease protein